jgi:hypothetical protein
MSDLTPPPAGGRGASVTHCVRVDPSRSMKAITGEVEMLLDGLEDGPRRSSALLASELIAQVVATKRGWNRQPVGLTIQLREHVIRLEATGPVAPVIEATADRDVVSDDQLADWGAFVLDRLADRWGLGGGSRRNIWAEIEAPA